MSKPNLMANPQFKKFIEDFQQLTQNSSSIDETRKRVSDYFLPPDTIYEDVKRIEDVEISGFKHKIPVRIYIPDDSETLPVLIYFHRGGWVFGSNDEAEPVCRKLANHLGCIVASVEFRLAPDYPFPTPLEDCYLATHWIADNASLFGGDKKKLIVCGESCGGNLAAAVALIARNKRGPALAAQLLIYPIISSTLDEETYKNAVDQHFITKDAMKFFWSMYAQTPEHLEHEYASLDRAKDLKNLPPALIVTAEYDPLHHEGERYAVELNKAGVKTVFKCFPEVVHGFLDLPFYSENQKIGWIKEIRRLLDHLCH